MYRWAVPFPPRRRNLTCAPGPGPARGVLSENVVLTPTSVSDDSMLPHARSAPSPQVHLVTAIAPNIKNANRGNDAATACVKANVLATANALRHNQPLLAELCEKHGLDIRGAYYDLDTGAVEVLGEPAASPR